MVWDLKIQKKLKRYRQIKFEKYGAVSDRSDKVKKKLHVLQLLLLSKEREFIQMTKALLFDIDDIYMIWRSHFTKRIRKYF